MIQYQKTRPRPQPAPEFFESNNMKFKLNLLVAAALACCVSSYTQAQDDPTPTPMGAEKQTDLVLNVTVANLQGEHLGRIRGLGLDLANGRIVQVLVVRGQILGLGGKVIAVPPLALKTDGANKIYLLDVSLEKFKAAPEVVLTKWEESVRNDRVAASYRYFGQEPYFLEAGEKSGTVAGKSKVNLGYIGRSNKLMGMPVGNLQGQDFGKVNGLTLDIASARIINVIVLAPGHIRTMSVVPAMALDFDSTRRALVLDQTKTEFAREPRYTETPAANGQQGSSVQESYSGPRTNVALEQGDTVRDEDRTAAIKKDIRASRIEARNVEVGTINGRVTLRGWVKSIEDQRRLGEIAVAASSVELVDNQITVGKPVKTK